MILELVDGVSLEEKLRQGHFDVPIAIDCIRQVLSALAFAHGHGVIHRDIKPANILIAADGNVKVTDFGIARYTGAARLTGTGLAVGTLAYMSPEQIRSGQADARSDIYSLGLTFYEMVTGRRAIIADTELALMNAQLEVLPPEPLTINPAIPSPVSTAIMRAVAKDPARRFQTALAFEGALQDPERTPSSLTTAASAIPAPELAALEARLSRAIGPIARHLVQDAARQHGDLSAIRKALAAQIEDAGEREAFLGSDAGAGSSTATITHMPTAPVLFDPVVLDRVMQALAPHLGPIAKVLVGRAARKARTAEELHDALAAEIPSAEDRRRFLAAVRSFL